MTLHYKGEIFMITKFRKEYFFLSNFYPCTITYKGITYFTSEAAYQAQKTLDERERIRISELPDPKVAKEEGQKLNIRPDWDNVKLDEMYNICKEKFTQNPELADLLMKTGDEEIVEGNDWDDTFWGVCNGVGLNYLGKTLMKIRSEMM